MKKLLIIIASLCCFGVLAMAQESVDADAKYATEMIKKGAKVPSLVMNDPSGVSHNLKSYRGKWVVLDFWASWCPDCRQDMPAMKQLYEQYASDKIAFIGVSFDTEREKLVGYVADNDIPWLQLCDYQKKKDSTVGKAFQVKWIPSMYLIDPKGRVVIGTVMIEKLAAELSKIN